MPKERKILLFFLTSKRYRNSIEATILNRLLSNSSAFRNQFLISNLYLMTVVTHSKQRVAIIVEVCVFISHQECSGVP